MHEIELKFQVDAAVLPALEARLQGLGAQAQTMRARYVDSDDRLLARGGFALRLRCENGRWVQTLKGRGEGVMQRLEHNADVLAPPADGEVPALDLGRHADSPAGRALQAWLVRAGRNAAELRLQYETDFLRLAGEIEAERAGGPLRVELALDRGSIRSGGCEVPIAELEFELLAGPPAALVELARGWVEPFALWLDVRSKAERGDRLARRAPAPVALLPEGGSPKDLVEPLLANAAVLMAGEGRGAHIDALLAAMRALTAGALAADPAWSRLLQRLEQAAATASPQAPAPAEVGPWLRQPQTQALWLGLLTRAG
ncbi:MAG TPA: CYTH domain-containing protein [Burkholderiaceae bacterium]|nr:CYTH domain-containing protein [Burkholderiaceae bacterium]HNB43824.1 CYTH domain-containing protein [Burkholderiaceae bacterium]HNG77871.1 CYTH domain-containing protein [Burkholderiaceae bacterium]